MEPVGGRAERVRALPYASVSLGTAYHILHRVLSRFWRWTLASRAILHSF